LDKLIKKVVEMDEGQAAEYWGNYSDYMEKREKEEKSVHPEEQEVFQKRSDADTQKERKRKEAEARQAVSRDRNRLNKEIERLETQIDELEQRLNDIEAEMADPQTYSKSERVVELQKQHASIKRDLPSLYDEWEQKRLQLEDLLKSIAEKVKTN
jgi:ATP-binding cassette subfamily F protein 3